MNMSSSIGFSDLGKNSLKTIRRSQYSQANE